MEKIIVFGNGHIATILSHYLCQQYEVVAYTVDDEFVQQDLFNGKPLVKLSQVAERFPPNSHKMICAIGFLQLNKVRENAYLKSKALGYSFINYIDKNANVIGCDSIGENNFILDNVSIQPGTTIGNGNMLWSNSTLAHGTKIQHFNWITSGTTIAGDVVLGSRNFLGINASIAHQKVIADDCFISANTLVNTDLISNQVVLSSPGEVIKLDSHKFLKFSGM